MRHLVIAIALAGCIDPIDPQWTLDHEHVVALRASPPRLQPGESAELDALVAHDGAPVSVEVPAEAAAVTDAASLEGAIYTDRGRWWIYGPSEETLALARTELGLAVDALVPLDVYAAFPRAGGGEPMLAKKRVWLGSSTVSTNPAPPLAMMDDALMADSELVVPRDRDVYLSTTVPDGWRVNWLSSCGTLFQDDVATSFLHVHAKDSPAGELAVVVRSPDGGVAWRVWPIRSE